LNYFKDDYGFRYFNRLTALQYIAYTTAQERMAGVPNTLPLQDLNRDAELGRVGCSVLRAGNDNLPKAQDQVL